MSGRAVEQLIESIAVLDTQLKIADLRRASLASNREAAQAELQSKCSHPKTRVGSAYFAGTYYDVSYTERWSICEVCGKSSEKTRTRGGFA